MQLLQYLLLVFYTALPCNRPLNRQFIAAAAAKMAASRERFCDIGLYD